MTFVSLVRPIESALARGYLETENVGAVVRAIVPGMQLRSYVSRNYYSLDFAKVA